MTTHKAFIYIGTVWFIFVTVWFAWNVYSAWKEIKKNKELLDLIHKQQLMRKQQLKSIATGNTHNEKL